MTSLWLVEEGSSLSMLFSCDDSICAACESLGTTPFQRGQAAVAGTSDQAQAYGGCDRERVAVQPEVLSLVGSSCLTCGIDHMCLLQVTQGGRVWLHRPRLPSQTLAQDRQGPLMPPPTLPQITICTHTTSKPAEFSGDACVLGCLPKPCSTAMATSQNLMMSTVC